jgi:hypothetical protein
MKPATVVTLVVLTLIALLHVIRLVAGVPVTVGSLVVPVWGSLPAAVLFGALAVGLWREHRRGGTPGV